jgi:uncharacterized protein (DUF1697 family)
MRYAVFLRAINTGDRRVKMADLRSAFVEAGYTDVSTFLASGNLALTARTRPSEIDLSAVVEDRFGFESEAFVRSRSEVRSILDRVPWAPEDATIEVSFLGAMPSRADALELEATAVEPEEIVVSGREVFFRRAGKGIETTHKESTTIRVLDTVTTRRGFRTVRGIFERYLVEGGCRRSM